MPEYEKRSGVANMAGEHFETKMATLLFLRGVRSNEECYIASNMAAAGNFDDLVFTLGQQTAFLQLKHKQKKDAKIYTSQLLTVKGDFSLLAYCKSYVDMKREWQHNKDLQFCGRLEDSLFIVFTNACLAGNGISNVGSIGLYDLLNTQGKLIQFTEQQHRYIYHTFEILPRYKQLLSQAVSGDDIEETPELLEVVRALINNKAKCIPNRNDLVKLLADLESLGDLSEYREFLNRLLFYTEQTRESGLDSLIRSELKALFGNDTHFLEMREGMEIWWKKSNTILSYEAGFFQNIIKKIAANFTKKIPDLKINFVENECEKIRQLLTSCSRMVYLHTQCTSVSSVKVLQSLQTDLLIDVSTLQSYLNEVLVVWRLGMCDVLVVEGDITDANTLHQLVSMSGSKHVVMISSTEPTQLYQQSKFLSFTDTFNINQLDPHSQNEVLEHEIMFQGFPLKLNSLADVSFLRSAVTGDVMVQLLHNSLGVGHKLDDLDPCYISRKFLRREYVGEKIFKEQNITFAVSGICGVTLEQLVPHGEKFQKVNVNNVTKDETCRYFQIEGEDEFNALCTVNDNIHWIAACEGGFLWKFSKGDMSPVVKHLEQKFASYANSEEVVVFSHQLVLIVAEPGMGKSTEMCKIAHMMKEKDPSTWVVKINLNQYTNLLSQSAITAVEFVETVATSNTVFQKALFKHQLQSNGNIVIILDGFDEIAPNYSEKVLHLLREFSLTRINKIFVTSRPVMLEQLQQKLSTLAFLFEAFTLEDQDNFLTGYWNLLFKYKYNLTEFISPLLQLVGTSFDGKLMKITGIPLQCRMLAEVFQDDATHYCQTGRIRLPQSLNVLELYEKLFDKKCEVQCKKMNLDMNNAMQQLLMQKHKLEFQQSLMNCAVFSYFDDDYKRFLNSRDNNLKQNEVFMKEFNSGREKNEIIISFVDDRAVFVHQTFAEYFVAKWFSQNFQSELDSVKKIYFCKNFEVVQNFLDRILSRDFKIHTSVLNEDLPNVKHTLSMQNADVNEKDEGGRTALHLAIMNYYYYSKDKVNDLIIETLLQHGADINCEDEVLHWRPLRLAEEMRVWSLVDKLLENKVDSTDLVWIRRNVYKNKLIFRNPFLEGRRRGYVKFVTSALKLGMSVECLMSDELRHEMYSALSEGCVNVIRFILNCGVSVSDYIHDTSMLHIASMYGQLRLSQFLIDHGFYVDLSSDWNNRTPLMESSESGHVNLVELLMKRGASINTRDVFGNTTLSLAAKNGKYEVIDLLLQKGADVDTFDKFNGTPLMDAARSGSVNAVELLVNHGASINRSDSGGNTALSLAAFNGNYKVVDFLLQKGADVDTSDRYNRTPLTMAFKYGHVHMIELLIKHGASVNTRDEYGDTALLLAVLERKYEVVELLLQKGATDIDKDRSKFNRTPLMEVAKSGHVKAVEVLIKHGASVNARDKDGNTALSLAAMEGKYEVVELLLQSRADVDASNKYNRTALMTTAKCGHVHLIELLLKHEASVNARDKDGNTALSLAAMEGKCEVVELLLQSRADVNASNKYNRTALMMTAKSGHVQLIELLLKHGASVNARDENGCTALSLAVQKGKYKVMELLLQNGADVNLFDQVKRTPLMQAAESGHLHVVECLMSYGVSVNARDEDGNTALSLAASKGKFKVVELLLQKGADADTSNKYDETPLMMAAKHGNVSVVELLTKRGPSVKERDEFRNISLLSAASGGKYEVVELLLQEGADINVSDHVFNRTPLMMAAESGHVHVVELLMKHGASVNARDEYGKTALSFARRRKHNYIGQLLLSHGANE